ncbi:MAG TPA: cob(I)yrinic acid a,c-diamide adenosyltransferase [Polyangiales bacterium]|nr:cob(I)yrinic acid a,c-diamide adenosyltransferase [Polyangiales bacterium]
MKIYTKTGDRGDTGLFGGAQRYSKASLRVSAYGEVDELNSVIGLVLSEPFDIAVSTLLTHVQSRLFDVGAELATIPDSKVSLGIALVDEQEVAALEQAIDEAEKELAPLKTFVLPGGSRAAGYLHLARTVCRRAERAIVALAAEEPVRPEALRYVNRLSDALFTFARLANHRAGIADVPWVGANRKP